MSLFLEIVNRHTKPVKELTPSAGPITPNGWSIGHLANHGLILSCDGFQITLSANGLQHFFDIAESGDPGEIRDQNNDLILVEPTSVSIVITRTGDKVYPNGLTIDMKTLKELGIEENEPEDDDELESDDDTIKEAIKAAYRRSGKRIKRGFRVTSGFRKGRVVANIKTAYKPRAKASTRMKLSIQARKKRVVRVLKSKRTRRKALSKRLVRLNKSRK